MNLRSNPKNTKDKAEVLRKKREEYVIKRKLAKFRIEESNRNIDHWACMADYFDPIPSEENEVMDSETDSDMVSEIVNCYSINKCSFDPFIDHSPQPSTSSSPLSTPSPPFTPTPAS